MVEQVNTPEELKEAHRQVCFLRGIDPDAKRPVPQSKLEIRNKIEEHNQAKALECDAFELHTPFYHQLPSIDHVRKRQLSEAAKKGNFGNFTVLGEAVI